MSARTVINYKALTAIQAGFVDGFAAMGKAIIERTRPPDAPPIGQGLVQEGAWGVWAGGKKVAQSDPTPVQTIEETVTGGSFGHAVKVHKARKIGGAVTKPRQVKLPRSGIVLVAGYDFPARFNEFGTIHQPARPFFTPSIMAEIPSTSDYIRKPVRERLAKVR